MEDKQTDINIKKIFDFIRITPLVSIGFGFVATSLYFVNIGYFPQNDINSLISTLIYVTLTSFIILSVIALLSYLAVVLWVRNIFGNPKVSQWFLEKNEIEAACLLSLYQKIDDKKQRTRISLKIIKYYFFSLGTLIAITLPTLASILHSEAILTALTSATIIIAGGLFLFQPDYTKSTLKNNPENIQKYISDTILEKTMSQRLIFLLRFLISTAGSALLLLAAIILLLLISRLHSIAYSILASIIVIALSTISFSYVIESDNHKKAHITMFLVFIGVILMITQGKIIESILKSSKLGGFNASIFVDYDTCTMFSTLGKYVGCHKNGLTKIDGLSIEWRGADQYITFNDDSTSQSNGMTQSYIIIPSSEIHGEARDT